MKIKEKILEIISRIFSFILFFYMLFFLLDRASIINTIVATISRILIKLPPMLKSTPIKPTNTTKPPNQRKKGIFEPPFSAIEIF